MYTKVYQSTNLTPARSLVVSSHHNRSKKRPKNTEFKTRDESQFNTKSYRDALQRSFNRAKQQIYFNPDMKYFVTLTYVGSTHTIDDVINDLRQFFKKERRHGNTDLKYIWVAEYQKRGSIHVHLITNGSFETFVNKNGYDQLTNWSHGFSSFLSINDFDNNFKPYLYLFKYMRKSERIGKSFIHASKNLNNFTEMPDSYINHEVWNTINQERTTVTINQNTFNVYRYYLQRDTIPPQLTIGDQLWQNQIQQIRALQSKFITERAKKTTNHLKQ